VNSTNLDLIGDFSSLNIHDQVEWLMSLQEVGEVIKQHMSGVMHNNKCLIQVVHNENVKNHPD
jgi:hypothetical protein